MNFGPKFENLKKNIKKIVGGVAVVGLSAIATEAVAQKTTGKEKEKIGNMESKSESFSKKYERFITKGEEMPDLNLPVEIILISNTAVSSSEGREKKQLQAGSATSPNVTTKGFSAEGKYLVQVTFINSNNKTEILKFILSDNGNGLVAQNFKDITSSTTGNSYTAWTPNQ